MEVRVFLHGRLGQGRDGYSSMEGLEVTLEPGATVKELLLVLQVTEPARVAVVKKGRLLRPEDEIFPKDRLDLLQAMAGG